LPNVQVEYQYDNSLSQKMTMMNLRHKWLPLSLSNNNLFIRRK
jgi:hypothetical protein